MLSKFWQSLIEHADATVLALESFFIAAFFAIKVLAEKIFTALAPTIFFPIMLGLSFARMCLAWREVWLKKAKDQQGIIHAISLTLLTAAVGLVVGCVLAVALATASALVAAIAIAGPTI